MFEVSFLVVPRNDKREGNAHTKDGWRFETALGAEKKKLRPCARSNNRKNLYFR